MAKWLDALGTMAAQFQIGIGGSGLRRIRFRNSFSGDLEWEPTANRTLLLPDASGAIALAGVGARVYNSVSQSIASDTNTTLAFNSERFDTNVIHDLVIANNRLTCKTAGIYLIGANVEFSSNMMGIRQIAIQLNGSIIIAAHRDTGSSNTSILGLCTIYPLNINDYVQVLVYQNSGAVLNILANANYSPEFFMQLLP